MQGQDGIEVALYNHALDHPSHGHLIIQKVASAGGYCTQGAYADLIIKYIAAGMHLFQFAGHMEFIVADVASTDVVHPSSGGEFTVPDICERADALDRADVAAVGTQASVVHSGPAGQDLADSQPILRGQIAGNI